MDRQYLENLHCPFTDSAFTVSDILSESNGGIEFGVVKSEGGEFPIVDGILRLQPDPQRDAIVDRLRSRKVDEAMAIAIDSPARNRGAYIANGVNYVGSRVKAAWLGRVMVTLNRNVIRILKDDVSTFAEATEAVGSEAWKTWQLYRFSMPTFLPTYGVAHLFEGAKRILDFGSGVGHGAFWVSRYSPTADVTCVDCSFTFLALAKKYFLPRAHFVCLDGDYPLPFESGYFSGVFSTDALHCIDSKAALAREFLRVLSEKGVIALPHLHSTLASTRFGKSMTPSGYASLFRNFGHRIIPEEVLIKQFFEHGQVDLERQYDTRELAKATAVSVVASRNSNTFRVWDGLWEKHVDVMSHPIINPIYRVTGGPGQWILDRRNIGNASILDCCPERIELKWESIDSGALVQMRKKHKSRFLELARALVLVEAPSRYLLEATIN